MDNKTYDSFEEMITMDDTQKETGLDIMRDMTSFSKAYSSFVADDFEQKKLLFKAINSNGTPLSKIINKVINIVDVVIFPSLIRDEETGEVREMPRVCIIDDAGEIYTTASTGVYTSILKLKMIFGDLHFENGLQVMVSQIETKKGRTFTLVMA